jgi:hypothetical protein
MKFISEDLNRDEEQVRKRGVAPQFWGKPGAAPHPDLLEIN